MDSIKGIWIDDVSVKNIQNGSNEPRHLQWTGFPDFLIYNRVQNATESGLDYLEAEASLNYLLSDGEELGYNRAFSQPRFDWNGIDHARLSGRGDSAAAQFTHTRRLTPPNATPRSLSSSI